MLDPSPTHDPVYIKHEEKKTRKYQCISILINLSILIFVNRNRKLNILIWHFYTGQDYSPGLAQRSKKKDERPLSMTMSIEAYMINYN